MFSNRILFSLLFFLFASSVALFAQNEVDSKIFIDSAQANSLLYRGKLSLHYGQKTPNDGSTYFSYSKDFEVGNVVYHGKLYKNVFLNLNAETDELYVKEPVNGFPVLIDRDFVDSFSIGYRKYIYYKQEADSDLKNGYYEVLYSGRMKLYKKIQKVFYTSVVDGVAKRGFTKWESFYLCKEREWVQVNTKADLKKIFKSQQKIVDHLSKTLNLNFRKNKEVALLEVLTYLDR
jgi:hypothetical protein